MMTAGSKDKAHSIRKTATSVSTAPRRKAALLSFFKPVRTWQRPLKNSAAQRSVRIGKSGRGRRRGKSNGISAPGQMEGTTEDQQQHSSSLQFGQSFGEADFRHSSGEHPQSAHFISSLIILRLWRGPPALRSVEDDDQDNDKHNNDNSSEDADYGRPEERNRSDSDYSVDVLPRKRHGVDLEQISKSA